MSVHFFSHLPKAALGPKGQRPPGSDQWAPSRRRTRLAEAVDTHRFVPATFMQEDLGSAPELFSRLAISNFHCKKEQPIYHCKAKAAGDSAGPGQPQLKEKQPMAQLQVGPLPPDPQPPLPFPGLHKKPLEEPLAEPPAPEGLAGA